MLTVISNLFTLLLGGVAAALLGHVCTQARGDREHRLKKLEELCLALDSHCNSTTQWIVKTARLDFSHAVTPNPNEEAQDYSLLTMLANIYFPELIPALQAIEDIKNESLRRFLDLAHSGDCASEKDRGEFVLLAQRLTPLHFEFRRKLIDLANRTRRGHLLSWIKDNLGS
ncbi:MAG: hypothetical protein NTV08_07105 [Verrucomicrobia bacterium]|nr:hypothetical protein [Verrucomicrobiota bacterium]